ncbi:MAG: ABC transporter ATP-binding protein [Desulfobacterales bacterium]
MEKEAIIQVKDLTSQYGDNLILDNVSFDVFRKEILVIAGSSGCGKTTLLRHMVGLNIPVSGKILINGIDITSCYEAAFLSVLKKIGILFQSSALFGSMTVADNVALPILEHSDLPESFIQDIVRMKLYMVDLAGYEDYFPSELSGGMKKRAGLARAQALNPEILFLDEPSAGLDPIISAEIDELILHINKSIGTTIIIITHELESIFHVARRVILLDKETKGIIAEGKPEDLKNHSNIPFVRQFFNRTKFS